jgi:hypothetical protein
MSDGIVGMFLAGCMVAVAAFQQRISLNHALIFEDDEDTMRRKKRKMEYEGIPVMYQQLTSLIDMPKVLRNNLTVAP